MPIPTTLVVPLDGSRFAEQVLPLASTLAEQLDADLALVTATSEEQDDRDAAATYLRQVATETPARVVDTIVADGPAPIAAIIAAARGGPDRMVCMTTHGRGRFRWAMIGSVAEGVVSRSDVPIVLAGPRCRTESLQAAGRVVICVDGTDASLSVVPHACELARALHRDIEVVFVGHPLDVEGARHPDMVLGAVAEQVECEGVAAHPLLLRSTHPSGALVDLAEEAPAALLAMTTHTRGGLARVALGSVTMGVLNSAPCPVLVTRPGES
jgi:nucleotide-binding universal stress UspA family protein